MLHKFVQTVVIAAVESQFAVVFLDELYGLPHLVCRETGFLVSKIQFADHPPCHGIAMQDGCFAFKSKAFEGMSDGMSQIQSLAYSLFEGVLSHDAFLYLY